MIREQYNQSARVISQALRRIFPFYLAFIGFVTFAYGILNVRIKANWSIGDWLINYRGGFVRRGLVGEICFDLAHGLHLSPLIVVLLGQLFFYGVIFFVIWRLVATIDWNLWMVFLLLSPATLAFHVLDPTGGFRKEIVLFAGLGVLLLWLLQRRPHDVALAAYLTVLCVVCVLSHEALAIFFPYLLGALRFRGGGVRRVLAIALVPLLASIAAVCIVMRFPGGQQTAEAICSSLGGPLTTPLSGICGGAIAGLTLSPDVARQDVLADIRDFHNLSLYSMTGLLAFLPAAFAFTALWRRPALRGNLIAIAAAACTSMAASSVLFYYATDWGRWIYIHLFCITLLLLAVERRQQAMAEAGHQRSEQRRYPSIRIAMAASVLIYALCWNLPHVGLYGGRFGYFGLAKYVASYRSLHPQIAR